MPLPSSPFDAAKSLFAGLAIIEFTPAGSTKQVFESKMIDSALDQEIKHLEVPDSQGILRRVRSVVTKQGESFKFDVLEVKRLLDLFGASLCGVKSGVCTLWIPDPSDISGKVALKSETGFACTISRDGNLKFGEGDYSKASIEIVSNKKGAITWTADAIVG